MKIFKQTEKKKKKKKKKNKKKKKKKEEEEGMRTVSETSGTTLSIPTFEF